MSMSDESQVIRGIDWRSTFPFTLIFRSFRIAIHPSKLLLALLALLLIYLGGRILDRAWLAFAPTYRAVPTEMMIFEESRARPNPREAFNTTRNRELEVLGQMRRQRLASLGITDRTPTVRDLDWRIKNDRDIAVKTIEDR